MIRRTNREADMTGPRQRYPLDTHDNKNHMNNKNSITNPPPGNDGDGDGDGDARSHSTIRLTTVHHIVMLSIPLLFIVGIFSLASMRERDMDLHHSKHHESTYRHSDDSSSLNNNWIPNHDVIKYQNHDDSTAGTTTRSITKNPLLRMNQHQDKDNQDRDQDKDNQDPHNQDEDQGQEKYRYEPSLNKYPLSLLKNLTEPISSTDVIFQFHIPKAAGTLTKQIFTQCFHLSRGAEQSHLNLNPNLNLDDHHKHNHNKIIYNMDTSTIAGISKAKSHNLLSHDTLDGFTSSHLHEACTLLSPTHGGRLFVMMRHPVEREISLFYYLGKAEWEDGYREDFGNMTLLEYATFANDDDHDNANDSGGGGRNNHVRLDNWMVRYLARKLKGEVQPQDVQLAKDILKYKSLIGLTEDYKESMRRFDLFHGIHHYHGDNAHTRSDKHGRKNQNDCVEQHMNQKINENVHETVNPESKEWKALMKVNQLDVELYNYAKTLYGEQGVILKDTDGEMKNHRRWNFRQDD
jgi:hypothetical protein